MPARDLARALAAGRVAIGVALLAAPRPTLGIWLGRRAAAACAPAGRALGARELLLGAVALRALERPREAAPWLAALAGCDAADLAATVAARRELPGAGAALVGTLAGGAAVAQAWLARELAAAGGAEPPGG